MTLTLSSVRIAAVIVTPERTHVHLTDADIPAEWLAGHGWDNVRLRARRSEWWDVCVDGVRVRFEIAWADLLPSGKFRLRFSCPTPSHRAVVIGYRVGQVCSKVTIKRCAPPVKQRELELAAKSKRARRVTVEMEATP